ncbi:MAG: hypothetical protein FJX76_09475 [Armatimonadetes bacterium]|nr:hypothetical protein [Armatimonadota bacterium]
MFAWPDASLDARGLSEKIRLGLANRAHPLGEREARLLGESWAPPTGPDLDARLALHFMERFAPITGRVARGLAYTAITTMRLERPIGQQEEFNRAALLFSRWAMDEIARLRARIDGLEGGPGGAEGHSPWIKPMEQR